MENLIEKINKKGQEIRNEETRRILSEKESFDKKLETINSFGERISKMWDIAQALLDNGFRIGEEVPNYGLSPYHKLETNGWYHWIGFSVSNDRIQWFGIEGGGACGRNFMIDKSGNCLLDKNAVYGMRNRYFEDCNNKNHLDRIIKGFDEYEKKFYEYVETIVS